MTRAEFTIGSLSDQTGVNIETIRYYERINLIPRPPRTASGRRLYDVEAVKRLAFVKRARELGFSIEDIRTLLAVADGGGTCAEVYDLTRRHLEDVTARIEDLERMRRVLSQTAERCAKDASSGCAIVDALTRG